MRAAGGRTSQIVIACVAIFLIVATVLVTMRILDQSDEHLQAIKNVKVTYSEAVQFKPNVDNCAEQIKRDMAEKPDRKSVSYRSFAMSEEAAKQLSLMHNLTEIDLQQSTLDDKGLAYLKELPLRVMNVAGTEITSASLVNIGKIKSLEELDLGDDNITDTNMEQLGTLPRLRWLNLTSTSVTADGIAKLHNARKLRTFQYGKQKITAETMAAIAKLETLVSLSFNRGYFNKHVFNALASMPLLTRLNVAHSHLTDEDIKELVAGAPNLLKLTAFDNSISDAGLKEIEKLRQLRILQIYSCPQLTANGINQLRKALPKCNVHYQTKPNQYAAFTDSDPAGGAE